MATAREWLVPVLAFPGVMLLLLLGDQFWLAPRRAQITWPDAAQFWQTQSERRPHYGTSHLRAAVAHATLGNWPQALDAYDRALRADPHLEQAASGRATALSELGRAEEGRADLERFFGDHPLCAVCALSLALWDDAFGERERAVERAERAALLAAARFDYTLEHDGWLVAAQLALDRNPERALVSAERALRAQPGSASAADLAAQARARIRARR